MWRWPSRGDSVLSGPGLAVVAHDELEALSDGQLTALAFGVSVLLGRPTRQRFPDDFLVVVEDRRPGDVSTAPGYQSNGRMGMHTDPTDAAVLACLTASAMGGESLFASAAAVHDVLAREAPTVLDRFRRSWTWDLRGAQRPGTDPLVDSPIFGPDSDDVRCRFGWLLLHEGARATGRLTPEVAAALELFEEVARRPELTLRHRLRRGESVWIDNYRVLHGREAFEDRQDTGVARRLIRIWLWLHEGIPLPTGFAAFSAAIDRGSLGLSRGHRDGRYEVRPSRRRRRPVHGDDWSKLPGEYGRSGRVTVGGVRTQVRAGGTDVVEGCDS